jgi:hypothetical protein
VRRAVALTLAITLVGCFPHNARRRRIAKYAEGGALVAGIAMQFVVRDRACMEHLRPGTSSDCDNGHLDVLGLGLIMAGLLGFAATVMTTPDGESGSDDDVSPPPPPPLVWAPPQSFCSALHQNNNDLANAALTSYVRSIGATQLVDIRESLISWLSRQPCVVLDQLDDSQPSITFNTAQGEVQRHFTVDLSAAPTVMLFPN